MMVEHLLLAYETGCTDKTPSTGSVARPLVSDATSGTPSGFLFFIGSLNEGRGPS